MKVILLYCQGILTVAGVQLAQVPTFKYLGLTLTTHVVGPLSGVFSQITRKARSRA